MHKVTTREEYEAACIEIDEHLSGVTRLPFYEMRLRTDVIEHYQFQERQHVIEKRKRDLLAKEATNE